MDDVKHMQGIWLISEIFVKDKTTSTHQLINKEHTHMYAKNELSNSFIVEF